MSERKQNLNAPPASSPVNSPLFTKDNYTWMLIGGIIIALAMLLMSGGKSADPKVFGTKEVYSATRITIAPILFLLGLAVEIYAIFKKPKAA